ncbi:serine-rich adhesin for platelets-like [Xyrauchen texanus]|uniref:serine-rich adhesin for platelets-like n=1 Tax=Xyrauchen texanus TaxID=154827 RepID=UPI0022423FF0|nr:serine-rich adhesin for platelets-like [Xyrauchen texanus]
MNALEGSGDPEGGGSVDLTGKNKSTLKSFKSRLFGKTRGKDDDSGLKQSHSESNITLGVDGSEDDLYSKGMMGSRALSHDSIFLLEHSHKDPEPPKVLSQENIHGNIRALQMKLRQQKMHLGLPPLPMKRPEDLVGSSEDDGLPRGPSEMLCGKGSKSKSNKASSKPLSPLPISPAPAPLSSFATSSGVDFNAPPHFNSLLDSSAARHRMSIKPKNQRAGAKNKRLITSSVSRPRSESLNNLEHSLTEREENDGLALVIEKPRARSYSSQVLHLGERLTASHIKSVLPVSHVMSLRGAGDSKQAENEHERSILSTYPHGPSLKEITPIESPVSTMGHEPKKENKCIPNSDEAQAAKPPSPVVPIDRKGSEEFSCSKLVKNSQSNLMPNVKPTVRTSVTTIQRTSVMKDEKSSKEVIQNKMDTLSKYGVQNAVSIENSQSKVQNLASTQAPANMICGVNLIPSSLRRNVPSTDEKNETKTLQPVTTVLAVGQEDHSQTESTKRKRPVSGSFHFIVSSDKNQERPRTASFTGVVGQARLKKEPPCPAKPSLNSKIQEQLRSQAEKRRKDLCADLPPESKMEEIAATNPVVPTKFTNLPVNPPQARDVEESKDNELQETVVQAREEEVQEGVEEAEEAGEGVTEKVEEENKKEATNAFGVKLRSTSLSTKFRLDKSQNDRIKPLASQSDSTSCKEPEDQHTSTGCFRVDTKLKNPPLQTKEPSSSPSKTVCKDQGRGGFLLRQAEPPQLSSSPSKATKTVPSLPKEGIDLSPKETSAVSSQENTPTSSASEVSWMEMAREKTRSLQQLFTSRLPDFPGLQTTIRPTTLNTTLPETQTQISTSQINARITQNITSQQIATQSSLRQTSGRSSQLTTQFPPLQNHTRTTTTSHTSTIQICTNPTQTATSQLQVDSTSELQFESKTQICNSTTKLVQSTVTCKSNTQSTTHTVNTVKQLSSHPWTPQTPPIQQSSSLRTGPLQAPQTSVQSILHPTPTPSYTHLSSSPKLASHLVSPQSANTISQDQLQKEGVISGKADMASEPQAKENGLEDGRPMWAAGLGIKTSLVQRWESQTTAAAKAGEQTATTESQTTPQSTVPLRPISKVTGTDTGLELRASVSSVPIRMAEREDKWQKKSVPPSSSSPSSSLSSSPLQSGNDSSQPSWMELAKRKSMAWSDKSMD